MSWAIFSCCGSIWARTLGREQYDWLRETLESSNATFKFVFLHYVYRNRRLYARLRVRYR